MCIRDREHVDHKEEKAVSAAYQFYKMSKAESFSIESFRGIWEKNEGIGQEDAGPAGHAGEAFYGDDGYPCLLYTSCFRS